eukprot:TRINITY_DN37140_c0_g1_i1.p1 TRINITY_DN37140_c0_g1~~TRINITY_DN37140_c0_g1_i1.p1  ORF type:complete len:888 (+),score=256.26 TRINITY_DN37140_c0_g1_i1:47-2665(+)
MTDLLVTALVCSRLPTCDKLGTIDADAELLKDCKTKDDVHRISGMHFVEGSEWVNPDTAAKYADATSGIGKCVIKEGRGVETLLKVVLESKVPGVTKPSWALLEKTMEYSFVYVADVCLNNTEDLSSFTYEGREIHCLSNIYEHSVELSRCLAPLASKSPVLPVRFAGVKTGAAIACIACMMLHEAKVFGPIQEAVFVHTLPFLTSPVERMVDSVMWVREPFPSTDEETPNFIPPEAAVQTRATTLQSIINDLVIEADIDGTALREMAVHDYAKNVVLLAYLREEMQRMKRKNDKYDASLGIFETEMHRVRDTEAILRENQDLLQRNEVCHLRLEDAAEALHTLHEKLAQATSTSLDERIVLNANSAAISCELQISKDENLCLLNLLESTTKELKMKAKSLSDLEQDYAVQKQRLADLAAAADEAHLRERKARVFSEKQAKETELTLSHENKALKQSTFKQQLESRYTEASLREALATLKADRDRLKLQCDAASESLSKADKHQVVTVAHVTREADVCIHEKTLKIQEFEEELKNCLVENEALKAETVGLRRSLTSATETAQEKHKRYIDVSVQNQVLQEGFKTRVELLEKDIEERARQVDSERSKLAAGRIEWAKEMKELRAAHGIEIDTLKKKLQEMTASKEKSLYTAERAVSRSGDWETQFIEENAAHLEARKQLTACKTEVKNLKEACLSIHDNIHFKILQEQFNEKAKDVMHLRNKVAGLEEKLSAQQVDKVVLQETCGHDLISKARLLETNRAFVDSTIQTLLEELKEPPAVNSSAKTPPPLLHYLTPTLQRDISLLASASFTDPIQEPDWYNEKPTKLQPLPIGTPRKPKSFTGLPKHMPGTVDSSSYFSTQRQKLVPSIYDLDW